MAHRISTIDTRHKVITHPYIQKGITFEKVLCQYTIFEQEVRFRNCTFIGDVVFGDETLDQAYCVVNADLVFDNCIFKNKVKLDGLQCVGHVIFKGGCKFEYGDEQLSDYSLSISNSKIGIGVCISQSNFNSGINMSAVHIEQVGCQFSDILLNNPNSIISFDSSYMGKELSIKASTINCKAISFNGVSVNDNQGTVQIGGNSFIPYEKGWGIESCDFLKCFIQEKFKKTIDKCIKVSSLYTFENIQEPHIFFVNEDSEKYESQNIIDLFRTVTKSNTNIRLIGIDEEIDNTELSPVGVVIHFLDSSDFSLVSLFYLNTLYILLGKDEVAIYEYSYEEFAPYIFDEVLPQNVTFKKFDYREHNSVPMIYATSSLGDVYIAIFDQMQSFKRYKWNTIQCRYALEFTGAHVGRGLWLRQGEFNVWNIDMHALSGHHEILFEDVIFNIYSLNVSRLEVPSLTFKNLSFKNKEISEIMINNPEEYYYSGINLECSNVSNQIVFKDVSAIGYDVFQINTDFMKVGNVLTMSKIRPRCDSIIRAHFIKVGKIFSLGDMKLDDNELQLQLNNASLNQWVLKDINWDKLRIETESIEFCDFVFNDKQKYHFDSIKKLCKGKNPSLIGKISTRKTDSYPIHFLKQLDLIYEKYDMYDDQRKLWKMRNRMRIRRDHPVSKIIRIPINEFLLNYGWSPWRIVFWLIGFIFLFDFLTWRFFGMDVPTSIVNGFVEFVPVSFNEPIVEQLHGINPQDPKYGPPLLSFGYSAIVTAYRLVSYTLLSVLIAAFAGYFRKKNQ